MMPSDTPLHADIVSTVLPSGNITWRADAQEGLRYPTLISWHPAEP